MNDFIVNSSDSGNDDQLSSEDEDVKAQKLMNAKKPQSVSSKNNSKKRVGALDSDDEGYTKSSKPKIEDSDDDDW